MSRRATYPDQSRREPGHRVRWYAWSAGQRMPRESSMRGSWGWDVECECGWGSRTGGGTRRSVEEAHLEHVGIIRWARDYRDPAMARAAYPAHFPQVSR